MSDDRSTRGWFPPIQVERGGIRFDSEPKLGPAEPRVTVGFTETVHHEAVFTIRELARILDCPPSAFDVSRVLDSLGEDDYYELTHTIRELGRSTGQSLTWDRRHW